jgi:hypothetical protein
VIFQQRQKNPADAFEENKALYRRDVSTLSGKPCAQQGVLRARDLLDSRRNDGADPPDTFGAELRMIECALSQLNSKAGWQFGNWTVFLSFSHVRTPFHSID